MKLRALALNSMPLIMRRPRRDETGAERKVVTTATAATVNVRAILLLVALALIPYLNALKSGFTWDDRPDIVQNQVVTSGVDPMRILSSPLPPGDLYRPFTVLTFALNQRLTPGNPWPFHLVNVLPSG